MRGGNRNGNNLRGNTGGRTISTYETAAGNGTNTSTSSKLAVPKDNRQLSTISVQDTQHITTTTTMMTTTLSTVIPASEPQLISAMVTQSCLDSQPVITDLEIASDENGIGLPGEEVAEENSWKSALVSDSELNSTSEEDDDEETLDFGPELMSPSESNTRAQPDILKSAQPKRTFRNRLSFTLKNKEKLDTLSLGAAHPIAADWQPTQRLNRDKLVMDVLGGEKIIEDVKHIYCVDRSSNVTGSTIAQTAVTNQSKPTTIDGLKSIFPPQLNGPRCGSQRAPGSRTGSRMGPVVAGSRTGSRSGSRMDRGGARSIKRPSTQRSERREMRATIRMAAIIGVFCGMWIGFFTLYVIQGTCSDNCYVPRWLDAFFFWLGYANSTVNPILYTIFNDEFRKAFQKLLGCYNPKMYGRSIRRR